MSKLKLIGITGVKQTGKTTFARWIEGTLAANNSQHSAEIYSFAKPLKEVCHILFGGTEAHWYGDFKTTPLNAWEGAQLPIQPTPRKILQYVGTEMFRNHMNPEFWLHVAHRYIADIVEATNCNLIIVDDVRFDNEAQFLLKHYDAHVVRLKRIDTLYKSDGDVHLSERGISDNLVDYTYSFSDYGNHETYAVDALKRIGLLP